MGLPLGIANANGDAFAATHWSVVAAARKSETEPELARRALAELCEVYWTPLYSFVRTRGYSVHDAQDLTQSFFEHLIENEIYGKADRNLGRFRTFLIAALKNFLADRYSYTRAAKRGGAEEFLPLDDERAEAAESLFQTHFAAAEPDAAERVFDRSWAETLVAGSLQRVAEEYKEQGKQGLFLQLKVFLTGSDEPLPSYDELAESTGLPASTLRSHVTRLRARYRELLRSAVRQTVASSSEVDVELRELFRVLVAS